MEELKLLYEITTRLRGENGCPWDREQTHESITHCLIEESYELIDTIVQNDHESMKEELGDVLFQVIFHSRLAEEAGKFTLEDVITSINEKLVRRHPHVFGEGDKTITVDKVLANWDEIKKTEKKTGSAAKEKGILSGIPESFPALMKAEKLQSKAAKTGFDWEHIVDVENKLMEEISEFREEIKQYNAAPTKENKSRMEDELGDIFFTLVNIARHLKISPEVALNRTNEKFRKRFNRIEQTAHDSGKEVKDLTLTEMDAIWEQAKG